MPGARHVRELPRDLRARGSQAIHGRRESSFVDIGHQHAHAGAGQRLRERVPDASGRTGDDCVLVARLLQVPRVAVRTARDLFRGTR